MRRLTRLSTLQLRGLSSSFRRCSKIDWRKEFESLHIKDVKPLPNHETVDLPSQVFKPKIGTTVDDNKAPLVLIHGLFGAKQNYSSVGKEISTITRRSVIGLDMRNHGNAPHAAPHNYMTMARDTIQYIEKCHKGPVALAGHLMGAKVSMLVSLFRPDLVEKLIVIDNSPVSEKLDVQFYRGLLGMCHIERDRSLAGLPRAALMGKMDKLLSRFEKDPLVRLFLLSNLAKRASKHDNLPVKFRVPVLHFLKDDVLAEMGDWPGEVEGMVFDKPVRVMKAAKSEFVTERSLENDFPRYFKDFSVSVYDCGHWLVSEQPEKFVDETVKFLEQ